MKDFSISFLSSILTSYIIYPIDVIKSQYQYNNIARHNNKSINNIKVKNLIISNWKNNYIKGFYKGFSLHISTYPIFWGIFFQINNNKSYKLIKNNYINQFLLSFTSSLIASTITNPLFVIKIKAQIEVLKNNQKNYKNIIYNIYNNNGFFGLMKGWKSTQLNNLKIGLQIPLYNLFISNFAKYNNNNKNINCIILSSFFSKIISSTLFYPLDNIRTYQRNSVKNVSLKKCSKLIYKKYGITGFYKGVFIYNCFSCPNFVLMMYFIELLNKKLK